MKYELGLAFIPEPMVRKSIAQHEIIPITLREEIPEREVCMVYDSKRPMSVAAQKLKKILVEEESEGQMME